MKPHIEHAHRLWRRLLSEDDRVIDATCGNGHDTLVLANCVPKGKVYAYDIQEQALQTTRERLIHFSNVEFFQECHSKITGENITLIVYNLGYLPGGDKALTTNVDTTLKSIQKAQDLLIPGGVISITCYPGHPEGKSEQKALLDRTLSSNEWLSKHHCFDNRENAPTLLVLQKLGRGLLSAI